MEIPGRRVPVVDADGMATRVDLFSLMFSNGLQLPFCRLIRDILNFLKLAPAQLHPNAWRIMVVSCIVFRQVLNDESEDYPDLTAREFLLVYWIIRLDGSLCSFQSRASEKRFMTLEKRFSFINEWQRSFLFISSSGWEYLEGEKIHQEFLI